MHPSRRAFLRGAVATGVVLSGACGRGSLPRALAKRSRESRERGAAALWALQAPDGAFRSSVYGLMRSGHSLTGFGLTCLGAGGRPSRPPPGWAAALDFLAASLDGEGALGRPGSVTDYPVYATALAIRAWTTAGHAVPAAAARWLAGRQLVEEGWEGTSAFGGFDMGHRVRPAPPHAGHVDLSMTRRALEALAALGHGPDSPAMTAADIFLNACAVPDGGFVYSPVELVLNKAGCVDGCRSYGTATADGVLALAARAGAKAADHALHGPALARLRALHRVDRNPGLEGGPMEAFGPAMRGCYRAAAAEVFARFGGPEGWRAPLLEAILAEQRADGTWASESPLQKEDEPIVATGFALAALAYAS